VSSAEAREFAQGVGALYFETSAKARDGLAGIQKMFLELARALPEGALRVPGAGSEAGAGAEAAAAGGVDLRRNSTVEKKGGCAC
jgi:hypothetical protein